MSQNTHQKHSTDNPPFDMMDEMIRKQHESEFDGLLLICTNGITSKDQPSHNVKQMVAIKSPEAIAQALFNQAIMTGDFNHVKQICYDLYEIARVTQENIEIELQRRNNQN
jgi:hypothetical protein